VEAVPLPGIGFLALVALAQTAPAASVPVRVEFDAPAGCSDADTFLAGVLARARHVHRAGPGETAVRLAIRLTRAGGRVRGELRLTEAGGASETRRVDGASCAEVVQVLSLTAALAIDPTAELLAPPTAPPVPARASPAAPSPAVPLPSESVPPPSAPPTPPPSAAPPPGAASPSPPAPPPPAEPPAATPPPAQPPAPPEPAPPAAVVAAVPSVPPTPPPPPGPRVGAAMIGARVLSSSVALGASVSGRFGGVTTGGLRPNVAVTFLFLPGDVFESGDDLGISWTALGATGCPGWWLGGRTVIEPCARITFGLLTATDHSISNPRSVDRWWGSAGALVHLGAPLGWGLGLDVDAGVDFPFVTRRFITTTAEPNQAVGATASVSPTLSVGLSHAL
jgi:hypothetical protein